MIDLPVVRFLVDWDNDSFFNRGVTEETPLNILKGTVPDVSTLPFSEEPEVTIVPELNDFGTVAWKLAQDESQATGFDYGGENEIVLDASTTYTFSVWVRGDIFFGETFRIDIRDAFGSLETISESVPFNWTRFDVTFTTGVAGGYVYFRVNGQGNEGDYTGYFAGWMIVEGSETGAYNVGSAVNAFDDITDDVEAANWQLGRARGEDLTIAEGTATFTLNNVSKIYSPEYTSSPLYGFIRPNIRMLIEVQNPVTEEFETMWAGWSDFTQPEIGEYRSVQATLQGKQGKFKLDALDINVLVLENVSVDEVIYELFKSGWISPANPYATIIGYSKLGINTFISDRTSQLNIAESTTNLAFVGEDWATGKTFISKALEDLMKIDRGYLWLDREGKVVYRNRNHYTLNNTPAHDLTLDSDLNDGDYHFGDQIFNSIRVNYYPKTTETNVEIFTTRESILVPRRSQKDVTVSFEFEEGSKRTVTLINAFDAASNPSTFTAVDVDGTDIAEKVTVVPVLKNGEATIKIVNTAFVQAVIDITLIGSQVVSYGNLSLDVVNEDSAAINGEYEYPSLNSKMLTEEDTAKDLGDYIIARYAQPFGTFYTLTIHSRDADWLERIIDMPIGTLIKISEAQTGVIDKPLIVVGEKHSWRPGILTSVFTMVPPELPEYWVIGQSVLGQNTYLGY